MYGKLAFSIEELENGLLFFCRRRNASTGLQKAVVLEADEVEGATFSIEELGTGLLFFVADAMRPRAYERQW